MSSSASRAARSSPRSSTPAPPTALEAALGGGSGSAPVVVLETEDGPLHVVVSQIAYYKRIVRAGRVGFSS